MYYQGDLSLAKTEGANHLIGIVGTRNPTPHGKRWTYKISQALAKKGFTIVSGLADGIDTIAHRACLDVGGKTIAVLGNGLDRAYPYKNKGLMAEIGKKGLILTEYEHGIVPDKKNFPARNRIVAGLCRAVLVMEAPEKSGALITARLANDFNRDVYSLPDSPENPQALGCLKLIHKGAEIIITEDDLLNSLGQIPALMDKEQGDNNRVQTPQLSLFTSSSNSQSKSNSNYNVTSTSGDNIPSRTNTPTGVYNPSPVETTTTPEIPQNNEVIENLSPSSKSVYQAIADEPTSVDTIVMKSGLNASEVFGILTQLEIEDLITCLPGMMYQKT